MVAYAFSQDASAPFTLTAGTTTETIVADLKSDPRWTTYMMIADQHSGKDTFGINISVPSVYDYCAVLHRGSAAELDAFGAGSVSHAIADTNANSSQPAVFLFCHITAMLISGIAMTANSLIVEMEVTQKVRIMRNNVSADLQLTPDFEP